MPAPNKGELKAFITHHLAPTVTSPNAEAKRLMPLLKKVRIDTTLGSVRQAVRMALNARAVAGGGNGTTALAAAPNGNAERRAELVRGADLLRDLAAARQTMSDLAQQVHAVVELLAKLEADTTARREHLERFASEWL